MKQQRLMVIAGGEWQVPIIRTAKAMGLFVINTNLYPDSPGFNYADVGLVADVLDREKQLAFAREYKPDGILTDQSDIAVTTVAYLCDQLGLPGIGLEMAEDFTNKLRMREFLARNSYPTPKFRLCSSLDEALAFASLAGYPVVLKPPASQASRGVYKVVCEAQLRERYDAAFSFSRGAGVLIEQFIAGTELTVEGIKTHSQHYTLAISRKAHFDHNPMVASELFYSPETEGIDYSLLRSQHDRFIEQMGLPFGLTHTEYIHSNGTFYLVETAARGGGTRISSDIVPAVSGIHTNDLLIAMALGDQIHYLPEPGARLPFAVLAFFNFATGTVRSITGLEEARSARGILDVGFKFGPGSCIRPPADDVERHGYFIAASTTPDELRRLCELARTAVSVEYA